jgi:hypothetical protein
MHNVQVGETKLVKFGDQMAIELRSFLAFVDAPHLDSGREADRRLVLSNLIGDSAGDLDGEACTILDRSAVLVGPSIRARSDELLDSNP